MPNETTAAATDDVDSEVLIEAVRKCPGIWDVSADDHRDKVKKRNAWFGICRKFAPDFDEKSEVEKNDFCNKLTNKWRNVKDNYYRYVKKRAQLGSKAGRSYLYAKQLSFLPATAHHWTPAPNLLESAETSYSESSDSLHIEPASDGASPPRPMKRRHREIASSPIHVISTPATGSSMNPAAIKPLPSMDEDRMFFESILPTIRTFDMDQKLEFRTEVMQLLKRVRLMTSSGQQHQCQNCGHDSCMDLQQTSLCGARQRSKRASAVPVTYLLQDLHPDCVQKYDDEDSLGLDDLKQ